MIKRIVLSLAAIGLVVAAGLVFALAPSEELRQAPFDTALVLGEQQTGRNVAGTVHSVRLAQVVESDGGAWTGETQGVWLVVDASVESVVRPALLQSWVEVDGLTIDASERADRDGIENESISPGIASSGSFIYELPADLLGTTSEVRIVISASSDARLDSVLSYRVNLADLTLEPLASMAPAVKGRP